MTPRGYSIRLFLPDGTPEGLRIVEKSNWVGRGIVCPRVRFQDVRNRDDFTKTGVYVLTGPSTRVDLQRVYVGEGDPIRPRIESHFQKKDFWTTLTLFLSKDQNLNKAHVQYLEAKLVSLALDAKRCELENANIPQLPSLSEADVAEVEGFLDEMLLVLPVLGITAFEKPRKLEPSFTVFFLKAKGLSSSGYESPQGFVVLKGSESPIEVVPSVEHHIPYVLELRNSLLDRGILVRKTDRLILEQDYVFDSPSTAASVMLGRSANGRTEWKTLDGRTLKEHQSAGANGDHD